jgi:hypothetical protein
MLPSIGPRAARRPSVRRPLAFGVAVAGAALFVGSVATSAPQDGRPLGPSDLVPLSEPTLPAVAAGGGTLGGAAAAAPATPTAQVTPVSEALPLHLPPLGKRAEPLNPGGAAVLIDRPVPSARSVPSAPAVATTAPTQPPQSPDDPAVPGAGGSDDGGVSDAGGPQDDGSQAGRSPEGGSSGDGSDAGTPGDGGQDDRGGHRGGDRGATQRYAADGASYSQPQTYAAESDDAGRGGHQDSGSHSERSGGRHHR